jgi:hypothetical protein
LTTNYDFTIKRGDTLPSIRASLLDGSREPIDLTAASVRFIMRPAAGGSPTINQAATVTDAVGGGVLYAWGSDDTATPGEYLAEWEIAFGTAKLTVPNGGYLRVLIVGDLNPPE